MSKSEIQVFKHQSQTQDYNDEVEIDLVELFRLFWRRKRLIISLTVIFGVCSLAYSLYLPFIYRAESKILPPQQGSGRLAGFAAQMAGQFGGFADLVGLPSTATTGQMLLGILQTDSVVDAVIDKFDLMNLYSIDIRINARKATLKNLESEEDTKSGLISIAYLDKDPQRAADIANSFVDELKKKLQEISVGEAQERRNFFEAQLRQAQHELNEAEDAMINYQQASGVVVFESQTQALLASIASLRNQIAAKNVEISSLRSYARKDNPRLRLAQSQLEAMTKELKRLEEEQKKSDSTKRSSTNNRIASSDMLSSVGHVPELGIEYQRYVRALQFATAKYELMLRQYENARLSEASDLSTLMIIDVATPPDYKYKPSRARICIIGTMIGFMLGIFWIFGKEWAKSMKNKDENEDDEDEDYEE